MFLKVKGFKYIFCLCYCVPAILTIIFVEHRSVTEAYGQSSLEGIREILQEIRDLPKNITENIKPPGIECVSILFYNKCLQSVYAIFGG